MSFIKKIIKKILPQRVISFYHLALAQFACAYYGNPSRQMVVIGVTGTKGKTSTANFIWSCLQAGGFKTGLVSTAIMRIGDEAFLNPYKMTMPGRFRLQKFLAQMVKAGCTHCIVETTSEGIKQFRHRGIAYDVVVFTNLYPEHLESHGGSFENYKQAKAEIFKRLGESPRKVILGTATPKIIIVNNDSEHGEYFLDFQADRKITFGLKEGANYVAKHIKFTDDTVAFSIGSEVFALSVPGSFNIYNALPAIVVAHVLGVSAVAIRTGLGNLSVIPGRMEKINENQEFTVVVDYAHEKHSLALLLETAHRMQKEKSKIILLFGCTGGGRDKAKRPIMGKIAGTEADYVVITNDDPYEDDPMEILEDIAPAAEAVGKIRGKNLFVIEDRKEGIKKALSLAKKNDIVLIAGKGAEQLLMIGGKGIPWDDREIVRQLLRERQQSS